MTSRSSQRAPLVVGIDPGKVGGCAVCLDGRAVAVAHWRTFTRQRRKLYRVTWATTAGTERTEAARTPWEVGMALRRWLSPLAMLHGEGHALIAAEAAHVGRNARTGLALSRWGGALVGPLEGLDPAGVATWLEPDEWRRLVFRRKWWAAQAADQGKCASMQSARKLVLASWDSAAHAGAGRDEIDRRMVAAAEALFLPKREAAKAEAEATLPGLVQGLTALADAAGGHEHVYDAAGLACARDAAQKI